MPLPDAAPTVLSEALRLAGRGFRVVFIHAPTPQGCSCHSESCPSKGKHPVLKAWQKNASADADTVRDQYARVRHQLGVEPNLGIALGAFGEKQAIAIDVDDEERFLKLSEVLGRLPDTFTGHSARGARMFFTLPAGVDLARIRNVTGLKLPEDAELVPGVDVKAVGGQVVVAPSRHESGAVYSWMNPDAEVAELPTAWVLAIQAPSTRPKWAEKYTPTFLRTNVRELNRAKRYLEVAVHDEASLVSRAGEGGRNAALHYAACSLFPLVQGLCLGAEHGWVARELFTAGRASGLPELEIRRTIASAEKWQQQTGAVRVPFALSDAAASESPPPEGAPANSSAPADSSAPAVDIKFIEYRGAPANLGENVARMLEGDPVWRGGPRLDRYSLLTLWGAELPAPVRGHTRLDREIAATDYEAIQAYALREHGMSLSREVVERGVRLSADRHAYDSLVAFVESLPAWDRTPRIDTWLSAYLGCIDDKFHRVTGRAWLRAVVARAREPGLLVDIVPVLKGEQGTAKNFAIETLFAGGPGGAPWLTRLGRWRPDHPDTKRLSCSRWILHDDEFSSRDPKQVDEIKSWVSARDEQWTAKYSNDVTVMRRRALLVCSVNAQFFLHDPTGLRRWIVWRVGVIDQPALARDRLQLLAEAATSPNWREGLDEVAELARENAEDVAVEDGLVSKLHALVLDGRWDARGLASNVLSDLLGVPTERQDINWTTRLGISVRQAGGRMKRVRIGGPTKIRVYYPPYQPLGCET